MSFGRGAQSRGSGPAASCPCGSGETLAECCGPLLGGDPAPSAERLMRSRYTAFVLGDTVHLTRSWHPRTRPDSIDIDPETRWRGLEVCSAKEEVDTAVVSFRAHWRGIDAEGVLAERSRFQRRAGRWLYLDGEVVGR